ncbi:MAG: archaellin/type IV pilin N-terminal domain-containing protein [archaeon]
MVMNKRGISPLIATVLIIGFTVALAAVIMVWGQGFIKDMQQKTESGADVQLVCAQDVAVELSNACLDIDGTVKVTVKNDGSKDIKTLTLRTYVSASEIGSDILANAEPADPVITAFGLETINQAPTLPAGVLAAAVVQVEVIPVVEIEGKEVPCTQSGSKFPVGLMPETPLQTC